jgi:hypothetical protein
MLRRRAGPTAVTAMAECGWCRLFHDEPGGTLDHVVMTDPEGNEFCVV